MNAPTCTGSAILGFRRPQSVSFASAADKPVVVRNGFVRLKLRGYGDKVTLIAQRIKDIDIENGRIAAWDSTGHVGWLKCTAQRTGRTIRQARTVERYRSVIVAGITKVQIAHTGDSARGIRGDVGIIV